MDREFAHRQLERLGEMMGDGLHHEPDGAWIEKEYRKVFKALYPEHFREERKARNLKINVKIAKKLESDLSPCCKKKMTQSRSGSFVVSCPCGKRYKYGKPKKSIKE